MDLLYNYDLSYNYENDMFTLKTKSITRIFYFTPVPEGLCACDISKPHAFCATTTVEGQQHMFTPRQIDDADKA
jgi:hypothetical protein